ncbi:MAG: hypothetical protein CVU79_12380, partial [Elusimicrobia bacterium HGW-Elusimicrobia-3]
MRARDGAQNVSGYPSYYSVTVDTTPSQVDNQQTGDDEWQRVSGKTYKVFFQDSGYAQSELHSIQYAVSTTPILGAPLRIDWTDIEIPPIGQPSYLSEWRVSFTPLMENVTNYVSVRAVDLAGNATTYTDAFYVKKDITSPVIDDQQSGDSSWIKESRAAGYSVYFQDDGGSALASAQYRPARYLAGGATYYPADWTDIFSSYQQNYYGLNWVPDFGTLTEGENHILVRVYDGAGNAQSVTQYPQPFYVRKDTTPPVALNNQSGDNTWRTSNSGFYNVDFRDAASGSGVMRFDIRVSTTAGGLPPYVSDWTAVLSTSTYEYTQDWALPASVWNQMNSSSRRYYISARAVDFAYNTSTALTDAFYVFKDTAPPRVLNNQTGDDVWQRYGGSVYNVDFEDKESLLRGAQYIVRSGPSPSDTAWPRGWLNIFTSTGTSGYYNDWSVSFADLWEGTNYVFVRSSDGAGHSFESSQPVFYVKKDASEPWIEKSQTGDLSWRSSSGTLYGVFFNDAVSGVTTAQYRITDPSGSTIFDWTNIFSGTASYQSYASSWSVSSAAFVVLPEGTTSHVFVRCYDAAGYVKTLSEAAFLILKDTTPPFAVVNNDYYEYTHSDWFVDADLFDAKTPGRQPGASGLSSARYAIYTSTGMTGTERKGWTGISGLTAGATYFDTPWKIDFTALPVGTTCYVSVNIADLAQNTSTHIDAFRVLRTTPTAMIITINETDTYEWHGSSDAFLSRYFDVDFAVGQDAFVSTAAVVVYDAPYGGGNLLVPETIVISTGDVVEYNDDWRVIPATFTPDYAIWAQLIEGVNYVAIKAYDSEGATSTLYDVFVVRKDTTQPTVPLLSSPLDGGATNQNSVVFSWQASSDLTSGVTFYQFEVSASGDFSPPEISSQVYTNLVITALSGETTHFWRVRAADAAGNFSAWSSVFSVRRDTTPPTAPVLQTPANVSAANQNTVSFGWVSSEDSFTGVRRYVLEVSSSQNFSPINISSVTLSTAAPLLLNQATHYWRVAAEDWAGNRATSASYFSVLVDTTPPSTPALSSPLDGETTGQTAMSFSWEPSDDGGSRGGSGVAAYGFYLSTSADFAMTVSSERVTSAANAIAVGEGKYFWRVRAEDAAGNYSGFTSAYSLNIDTSPPVITVNQTGGGQWINNTGAQYDVDFYDAVGGLAAVQYAVYTSSERAGGTLVKDWTDITSPAGAAYFTNDWQIDFNALPQGATCFVSARSWDTLLRYATHYNAFTVLKDITNPSISDNQPGDDSWRKTGAAVYSVGFQDAGGAGLREFQIKIMRGALGSGATVQDWTSSGTSVAGTTFYHTPWPLSAESWNALPEGRNYVSARVFDNSWSPSRGYNSDTLSDAFYVRKDTTPPVVVNNQAGDDNWRNANNAFYNVDFRDAASGSGVQRFDVRTASYPSASVFLTDWIAVISTATHEYTPNWQLPSAAWTSIISGSTSCVWVRVVDFADNETQSADVFYVLKDTVPPTINNAQSGDDVWRKDGASAYAVSFEDTGGSRLGKYQIRASSVGYAASPYIFDWTDGSTVISGATSYATPWQLTSQQWTMLASGTNYISVRVVDKSFSTTTVDAAFYILKDTQPPTAFLDVAGFSSSLAFEIPYTVSDGGFSGISHVKIYYTSQTEPPYTYTLYASTTANPAWFEASVEGTYGFRLVPYDNALNAGAADPPSSATAPEATVLVDATPPSINDQQAGDDSWRAAAKPDGYAVYFNDAGSGLDTAQYIVRAGPSQYDTVVKGHTDIFSALGQNSFNDKWHPDFAALQSSWNYVSVRAWDVAGKTSTLENVFYIKKDTSSPVISYSDYASGGDEIWLAAARSGGYNVDFYDGLSMISRADYRIAASSEPSSQTIYGPQAIATAVSSHGYVADWTVNFAALRENSTNYVHVILTDIAGNSATHYAFFVLKDTTPPTITNQESGGDSVWRQTGRNYSVFAGDRISAGRTDKLKSLEYTARTAPALGGTALVSWTTPQASAVNIGATYYASPWPAAFDLLQNGTNYISVRAADMAGNTTAWVDAFRVLKDTLPPVIDDNQSGDTAWRKANNGSYSVSFRDEHSGVKYFRTSVRSAPSGGGDLLDGWRTILDNINATYYMTPWQLSADAFLNMSEGAGNYVSVACYDALGNYSVLEDAFYVRKDTTPPVITDNETDDETWYSSSRNYSVSFRDAVSLLDSAQYYVSTGPARTGQLVKGWTAIFSGLNLDEYTSAHQPDFSALSQGYNYVSVRAFDAAGNVTSLDDVYFVKKDTVPPSVITDISQETGAGEGRINLSWTSPLDPAPGGGISYYTVKYATFQITESGFDGNPAVGTFLQNWSPAFSGGTEYRTLTGLSQGRYYYTAVKSVDAVGNISPAAFSPQQTMAAADSLSPYAVTTLAASAGDYAGQIRLSWLAPGDNGLDGNLAGTYVEGDAYSGWYRIRRWENTNPVSNFDTGGYTQIDNPFAPGVAGSRENYLVEGLNQGSTYYFMARAVDKAGNFSTSNAASSLPAPPGAAAGHMLWGSGALSTPKVSRWTPPDWSVSANAASAASTVRWTRVAACPVLRNEKIVGVLAGNAAAGSGKIYLQRFDGSSWTDMLGQVNSTLIDDRYRAFDVAYERNSGRALVTYYNGTTGAVGYRVWSSTAADWVVGKAAPVSYAMSGMSGAVQWLRLASRPSSNQIIMAALDSNSYIFSAVWDGASNKFLSVSTMVHTTAAESNIYESFDVAWERNSGRAMVMWGQPTSTIRYSLWSSTASVWATVSAGGPAFGDDIYWVKLAADPTSDRLAVTAVGRTPPPRNPSWNVSIWDGSSAWSAPPAKDAAIETNASRAADIAWEKDSGRCVSVAGDLNSREISYLFWSPSDGWHDPVSQTGALTPNTAPKTSAGTMNLSGDINTIGLLGDPNQNKIMCYVLDQSGALSVVNWTGSAWAGKSVRDTAVSDGTREPSHMALDRHDIVPPTMANNQTGDDVWRKANDGAYSVTFNDSGGSNLSKFQVKATTGTAQSSQMILDWTDNMTFAAALDSYATPWQLSSSVWNGIRDGTNRIHVKVFDGAGGSAVGENLFYIKKDTTAPTAPSLSYPLTGAATNQTPLSFGWNASSDSASGVAGYEFYVSTASNFSVFTSSEFAAGQSVSRPLASALYYWRVRARDAAGNVSVYSSSYSVVMDTAVPSRISNVDGDYVWKKSSGTAYDVRFYDALAGLTSAYYRVWNSTGQSGTMIFNWTPINSLPIGATYYEQPWPLTAQRWGLLPNGTNYVSLRVFDSAANFADFTDEFFIRKDVLAPSAPSLSSPADGSTGNNTQVAFDWSQATDAHSGVAGYEFYVSTDSAFAVFASSEYASAPPVERNLGSGGYYWRVRAVDGAGNYSAYSSSFTLTISTSPPTPPVPLSPADGLASSNPLPVFDWSDSSSESAAIASYELHISTDIFFTVNELSAQSATSYYETVDPLDSGRYYWRARAVDGADNYSEWSSTRSIVIDTISPSIDNKEAGGDSVWRN